uniref:C2H2-type domain-containing protein n=1 Tax=Hucho hucho TaxID=62062 RepID=A0A4W5NSV8_9TELE
MPFPEHVLCHNTFDSTFFMRKHLKSQHGQLPYQCLGCGGNFIKNSHLREHKKRVLLETTARLEGVDPNQHPRYVNPADSSSSLATRESETEIQHSHSSLNLITSDTPPTQKPYLCEICGKDFLMLFRMKEHMRAHTEERPFTCRDCGKGFSRRRSLKRHRLIHTEGRLKSHRLIHTGERPFACTFCKLRYLTKKHLQRHMTKHCFKTKHFNGGCDVQNIFLQ